MMSPSLLPLRYYLLPVSIEAAYLTTTALYRWIKQNQHADAGAPTTRGSTPMLVNSLVVALIGREILRAALVRGKSDTPRRRPGAGS
jgi:hypothetical protein